MTVTSPIRLPYSALHNRSPLPPTSLFACLLQGATEEMVARIFRSFPGMEYCDLKRDRVTGQSKGYAYVNYSTADAAAAAVEQLNGLEFPPHSGQRLKVQCRGFHV